MIDRLSLRIEVRWPKKPSASAANLRASSASSPCLVQSPASSAEGHAARFHCMSTDSGGELRHYVFVNFNPMTFFMGDNVYQNADITMSSVVAQVESTLKATGLMVLETTVEKVDVTHYATSPLGGPSTMGLWVSRIAVASGGAATQVHTYNKNMNCTIKRRGITTVIYDKYAQSVTGVNKEEYAGLADASGRMRVEFQVSRNRLKDLGLSSVAAWGTTMEDEVAIWGRLWQNFLADIGVPRIKSMPNPADVRYDRPLFEAFQNWRPEVPDSIEGRHLVRLKARGYFAPYQTVQTLFNELAAAFCSEERSVLDMLFDVAGSEEGAVKCHCC